MWPWSDGYDFGAADNLERVLNEASGRLRNLLIQRGKWAMQYLSYQANGLQQGWVGTEYTEWARQFNESQSMLARGVNDLVSRAVDVHNASYRADTNQNSTRTLMYYPADQTWSGAPNNTAPDNTQAANPQCLYSYSDNATNANDTEFRSFFLKDLADAASAAPVADAASSPGNVPAPSSLARSIGWFLKNKLLELDARVRIVGEAFEYAGGRPIPGEPGFLQITQQQLDNAIGDHRKKPDNSIDQRIKDAQALAQDVQQHGMVMTDGDWNNLKSHKNDPVFTSAFFNSLPPDKVQQLLDGYSYQNAKPPIGQDQINTLAQAYASAYAGGLSPAIQQQVARFLDTGMATRFQSAFYNDLGNDPQAAANFMADFQQIHGYSLGQYVSQGTHTPPVGGFPPGYAQSFAKIMLAGTVGAENVDPNLAAQNVTALVTYYKQNPGSHTYGQIDAAYGQIIEGFWNDVTYSLNSTAWDPHGYLTSPEGLKLTPAQWAAFTQEAMRDGQTAGKLLTFAHSQADNLHNQAGQQTGDEFIGDSYEFQAGLINGFFDYQAQAAYLSLSADRKQWVANANQALGLAASTAINIIASPGSAAKTIIVTASQTVVSAITNKVSGFAAGAPLPQPHFATWQGTWSQEEVYNHFNEAVQNPAIQDDKQYLTEMINNAQSQIFVYQSGPLKGQIMSPADMSPQQLQAYNAWLMSPDVVQYQIQAGDNVAYQSGYNYGGGGTSSDNPAPTP